MRETTTDLKELKAKIKPFTWGEVIKIHEIAEYTIVESYGQEFINCCGTGNIDYSHKDYHCYVNGRELGRYELSLDNALAICIAFKHENDHNSQAAEYFMKMIDKKQEV